MKVSVDLTVAERRDCGAEAPAGTGGGLLMRLGRDKGSLLLRGTPGRPDGQDWRAARWLVADLRNSQPTEETVLFQFWEKGDPDDTPRFTAIVRLFPLLEARVVFDLARLDSQLFFPPLTPGTMKSGVQGDSTNLDAVDRFAFGFARGFQEPREFAVLGLFLTDEAPEFPPAREANTDGLGQWTQKDWPGKTGNPSQLRSNLSSAWQIGRSGRFPEDWTPWGGWKGLRLAGEGFFRVARERDRWWLVDPMGCAFFSTGVFGVYPGEPGWIRGNEGRLSWLPPREGGFAPAWSLARDSELFRRKFEGMFPDDTPLLSYATANLIRAFGPRWREQWTELTNGRLRGWGVNTLSMFSDPRFIEDSGLPFVIMLHGFPTTKARIFREFPDVFSAEYEDACRRFAGQLEAYAENRRLIGYFLNNEPTWGFVTDLVLAEKLLETGDRTASREALVEFLSGRYGGDIGKLNRAWGLALHGFDGLFAPLPRASRLSDASRKDLEDFSLEMVLRYARIPSEHARRAAPHHLNLGMRFANVHAGATIQTHQYFDVFSFNCYRAEANGSADRVAAIADKPLLVGEFHFGALDRGLPSPSLFAVASQGERGDAYARYVDRFALHPNAVGAHYFAYNDQPLWGRYDGENYQFGFVDVCNTPYDGFVDGVSRTNRRIYDLIDGRRPAQGGETVRL